MGFVMSFANPQRANKVVTRMKVKRYFLSTRGFFSITVYL
jgi:hypothetical protein